MKCEKCVAEGKRSTVTDHGGITTCMGTHAYYDEDGEYHFHDPNGHSANFQCSNGHRWSVTTYPRCRVEGCDFNSRHATKQS